MLKRVKKQPRRPTFHPPHQSYSPFQNECCRILEALKSENLGLGRSILLSMLKEDGFVGAMDIMLVSADFHIYTSREGTPPRMISISASYKNYPGYKLPWTETSGDKPVVYYKHKHLWVAVAVCFFTLCLRTDTKLWLPETTPSPSRPSSKRIKRVATRN